MFYFFSCGGLVYKVNPAYESLKNLIKDYACDEAENAFDITVSEDEFSDAETEMVAALRKVVRHCLARERMMIHGACISCDGQGFLFIAPSGTGKSTHISLWQKYLGDRVTVINGDKPMLSFDNEITVCGTPWNGKEGWGCNDSVPLSAIIQIKQSTTNSIRRLDFTESLTALYCAVFEIQSSDCASKIMNCLNRIISEIPVYELCCDISEEAFQCAYKIK